MNTPSSRFISRLTRKTLAVVLAGGRGSRLEMLTEWRAKPAVPFGGKFRIIDFTLSNCLNSGIRRISVLTQYKSHSLIHHLMEGWNYLRSEFGEFVELIPAQQWVEEDSWYEGTADAVYQSVDILSSHQPEFVLILAGDHIYKMDYGEMLASHVAAGADVTVACNQVPLSEASNFGVMAADRNQRIYSFEEKPSQPRAVRGDPSQAMVSMGIYVFNADFLFGELRKDAEDSKSSHDFGKDIIPDCLAKNRHVHAFPLASTGSSSEYWRDVGTIDSYYLANLELTEATPPLDLYDMEWPIWTYQAQLPPAKFIGVNDFERCSAQDSMVSGGCVIHDSNIKQSLLYSNVKISPGCSLDGVLALPDTTIGEGCQLSKVILDNGCEVPAGTVIGEDPAADERRFYRTASGVVVVNRLMLGQEREYRMQNYAATEPITP